MFYVIFGNGEVTRIFQTLSYNCHRLMFQDTWDNWGPWMSRPWRIIQDWCPRRRWGWRSQRHLSSSKFKGHCSHSFFSSSIALSYPSSSYQCGCLDMMSEKSSIIGRRRNPRKCWVVLDFCCSSCDYKSLCVDYCRYQYGPWLNWFQVKLPQIKTFFRLWHQPSFETLIRVLVQHLVLPIFASDEGQRHTRD